MLRQERLFGDVLTSCGVPLDTSPERFGWLRDSTDAISETAELRRRMGDEGYLYLPGFLDRALVERARENITQRLFEEGLLDPDYCPDEAVARAGVDAAFKPDLAHDNEPLHQLLYTGRMLQLYERLLGGRIRHFDFTWMRVMSPGRFTRPHGDIVFMGRGTHELCTAWVPLGDYSLETGGLMVLERSHQIRRVREEYARRDVDTYCDNIPGEKEHALTKGWRWDGTISNDPRALQEELGGRWKTARSYRMGDLLTFTSYTIHASLDNHSNRIRLSSDSRYQLAASIDERWIGEAPVGHGPGGKRGLIC